MRLIDLLDENVQKISGVFRDQRCLVLEIGLLNEFVDLVKHPLGLGVTNL